MPYTSDPTRYEKHRKNMARRAMEESADSRDIGPIPPVVDPIRKARGRASLRNFIEIYALNAFTQRGIHWPWSKTHLDVMSGIEGAVLYGERRAIAIPRGGSKTTLIRMGAVWATSNGLSAAYSLYENMIFGNAPWGCVLAATAPKAWKIIADIKMFIETNETFAEDYPEIAYPVRRLNRISQKQKGQTCLGRPTRMLWNSDEIQFADIPGAPSAGSIITSCGMEGSAIRGQTRAMPDGTTKRPTFVLIDDPQTDDLAKSEYQVDQMMELIDGAVMEMGPPGQPLAAQAAVTVIAENDVADRLLKDPRWNGIRSPMLVQFPLHCHNTADNIPHKDYWSTYGGLLQSKQTEKATEFYLAHQPLPECKDNLDVVRPCATCKIRMECMDCDAVVSWKHRKYPGDISAVQHAMNRHIWNPRQFAAEMQQSPINEQIGGEKVKATQMIQRVTGVPRGMVPQDSTVITAGVDIHDEILYYAIAAYEQDFTRQVIQYGTFPEQPMRSFRQAEPPRRMSSLFPGQNKDGVIQSGLEQLSKILLAMTFKKIGGQVMQIESLLADSGYKPTLVFNVRRKLGSPVMQASKGLSLTAKNKPIASYIRKPGWRFGDNWYVQPVTNTRDYPHVSIDTNHWKTFIHRSLAIAPGTRGALTLYGTPQTINDHIHFAEHVCESEYYVNVTANGRTIREYKPMPKHPDNHWFDCLLLCDVGASIRGCKPKSEEEASARAGGRPKFRSMADIAGGR